jgi:subtilisin family serine protease
VITRWPQRRGISTLILIVLLVVAGASSALAKQPGPGNLTGTGDPISVAGRVSASKNSSANPAARGLTAARITVLVKLADPPLVSYEGTVPGLPATSPKVTGQERVDPKSSDSTRYLAYLKSKQDDFVAQVSSAIPGASITHRFDVILGGVAVALPNDQITALSALPGVTAIYPDTLRQMQTDSSPSFIGATSLYPQLGGAPNAGKGVIFGVLDSGVWPEHPSFADNGNLGAPPAKADGTPRACDFGDNPLTPASDPFICNRKLIGGKGFLDTYNALQEPEIYGYTARDSNGHGTHTASTAAGDPLASARLLGVERGPINGIAPGAWISVYKVCGATGCYQTDSAAAVQQAIRDGVNVINFSISGGSDPFTDLVELAFLDAYAAGVFVAASAGNSGPGAATTDHLSPWVTTVAASTQSRAFESTLTLTSAGGATATFKGASITAGVGSPLQVVMASAPPYNNPTCTVPAPAGIFINKIVACLRSPNRVLKSFNIRQGGAAGMILYNNPAADALSDNHWLPTVHLADGTQFLAFMSSNSGVTGSFTQGVKATGQGDVMATFSSRGPGGRFIKPDVTAPGVQILAGHTPTPESELEGPPGEYFQAIAGTSMSSPHVAGSALLLKALNPTWTPGQIKSALMTTGITKVLKEDRTTPADPFDMGAGRINLTVAGNPGLTIDETAARMAALGNDPINAVQLNLPSINAPIMPGQLTVVRTVKNVSGARQTYDVSTKNPAKTLITVLPSRFTLNAGQSTQLSIVILSDAPANGQYFGEVQLKPQKQGLPTLHLPVAFVTKQGDVSLTSSCTPTSIAVQQTSTCTVTATNNSFTNTTANLRSIADVNVLISGANGATVVNPLLAVKNNVALPGAQAGTPSIAPGTIAGYIPLDLFGGTLVTPIGDEGFVDFNVPAYKYNGLTYTSIGVDANGYIVPGGGTNEDNNCCNIVPIPNPARPNNVLAPFWTDLDGTGATGILVNVLTDGVGTWIVVEWRVNDFGTLNPRVFQVWLGTGGPQDIAFSYNFATIGAPPAGQNLVVGVENVNGTGGQGLPVNTLPTTDLYVTSSAPVPGASVSYTVTVRGTIRGNGNLISWMDTPLVPGTTIVKSPITVTRR